MVRSPGAFGPEVEVPAGADRGRDRRGAPGNRTERGDVERLARPGAPALVPLLVLAACAGEETSVSTAERPVAANPRYAATTTVLESPDHGPQLCLGGVLDSYPPQCGGPGVVGWGWAVVDPATATSDAQGAALSYAAGQPDFAGAWIDRSVDPASQADPVDETATNDPTRLVLNLRFTGDLARHEAEARAVWGGALCLTEAHHALAALEAVQTELHDELGALISDADEVRGVVRITVVVVEEGLQESLDDRYGAGVVQVTGALRPVP